jgi:hypothetical protein
LYSARFPLFNKLPEPSLSVAYLLDDLLIAENSEDIEVDVTDLFIHSNGDPIEIEFKNSNPDLVTATLEGNTITLSFTADSLGQATISLIATSGEGFTVSISELAIYEQIAGATSSIPSQFFVDFNGLAQSADDFTIPNGDSWTLQRIVAFGGANNSPQLTNATVVVYSDNEGVPGEEIYNSGEIVPLSEPTDTNLNLMLPEEVNLESGKYWLSVYVNLPFNPDATQWFWSSQNGGIDQESHFKDNLDLFGIGATDWTPISTAFGRDPLDQVFQIYGIVDNDDASSPAVAESLTTIELKENTSVYPNPSRNMFSFNFKNVAAKSNENISIQIFNNTGNLVYSKSNVNTNSNLSWNASDMPSGLYMVKISGNNTNKVVKIIKR